MKKANFLFLFLFLCVTAAAQEQAKWSGTGIEANFWKGNIIRHTSKFTGEIPKNPFAFQLNIIKQTFGQKNWHQRRNFPLIGMGVMYINYDNPEVYGSAFGVYPMVQIPLFRYHQFEWTFNAGMGVSYVTKHYDRQNTKNVFIGGNWNNISPFRTDIRWRIDKNWDVQAGINFVHVSNAALQQPNLGINMWGGHIGLRFFPVTSQPEIVVKDLKPLKNRWLISARYSMAFIERGFADGPMFPVYMGAIYASKRYWSKNKVYSGFDYTYNTGVYTFLKNNEQQKGEEAAASYQLAGFVGNEFLLGRIGVVFQLGYYFKDFYQSHHLLYQKVGGNFYFYQAEKGPVKEVFATVLLKTHFAVAEFAELGIGISF